MAEHVNKEEGDCESPRLDNRLVASAAARLDAAKIPHVLWGEYMLTIFGIPTIVDGFDLVVEDDYMDAAYDTLHDAGFKHCESEGCISSQDLFYAPSPHAHLHITDSERVGLFKKSDILWRLPDLAKADGENIIFASDPKQLPGPDIVGRGGRFQEGLHPVRIPSLAQLVQTLLLLAKKHQGGYGRYWMNWITYILEFCTENGALGQCTLTGIYKTYINAFLEGDRALKAQAFACIEVTE